jgi:tetratricopeptide (TPR) repeat protein
MGVVLLVIALGTGTYVRNMAWANERTLWEDTLSKAPNSIRAHHELAFQYYEKNGQYDTALALYHRGLQLEGQNIYEKALSLNNIASIHFTRGEYDLAEMYWKKAIASFPQYQNAYYRLSLTQTKLGKWQEASETLSRIVRKEPVDAAILRLRKIISRHGLDSDTGSNSF